MKKEIEQIHFYCPEIATESIAPTVLYIPENKRGNISIYFVSKMLLLNAYISLRWKEPIWQRTTLKGTRPFIILTLYIEME